LATWGVAFFLGGLLATWGVAFLLPIGATGFVFASGGVFDFPFSGAALCLPF
jgi:hypothetical protein